MNPVFGIPKWPVNLDVCFGGYVHCGAGNSKCPSMTFWIKGGVFWQIDLSLNFYIGCIKIADLKLQIEAGWEEANVKVCKMERSNCGRYSWNCPFVRTCTFDKSCNFYVKGRVRLQLGWVRSIFEATWYIKSNNLAVTDKYTAWTFASGWKEYYSSVLWQEKMR